MRGILASLMVFVACGAVAQTSLAPPAPGPAKPPPPAKAQRVAPSASDAMIEQAKGVLARSLKDPFSAQYQNVRRRAVTNLRGEPMTVVCGEVNAKNSYGAFIGFAPWIYLDSTKTAFLLGPDRDLATVEMIRNFCG